MRHTVTEEEVFAASLRGLIISWFYKRISVQEMKAEVKELIEMEDSDFVQAMPEMLKENVP